MPTTTPNRLYPYPVDADPIDTAGDTGRLALAVDVDFAGLNAGHAAQQVILDQHAADIAVLNNSRVRLYTPSVQQFEKPVFEFRHYWITTDGGGNGSGAFAAVYSSLPVMIMQMTMEGQGNYYKVTTWKANMSNGGFAFNMADWQGNTIANSGAHFAALTVGTYA